MRRLFPSPWCTVVLIPALVAAGVGCSRATCAQDEVERNGECLQACNSDNNCARDERCNLGACELAPAGSSSGVASSGPASSGASSGAASAGSSAASGGTSRPSSSQAGSSMGGSSSAVGTSSANASSSTGSGSNTGSGSASTGSSAGSSSVGGGSSAKMDSSSAVSAVTSSGANSSSQAAASSTVGSSSLTPGSSSVASSGSSAPDSSSAPQSSSAGPADADGDNIPDVMDNCPMVANAGQEDEEQDGRGNVCDNCPGRANPGQDDSDGDNVGDACDPRPVAGDSLVLFDGFDGVLAATWVPNSGVWTQSGGVLTQSNTGDPNRAILSTLVNTTNVTVEGRLIITNCATQPCRAGFLVRVNAAGDGWGCAISRDTGNPRLTISQMTAFDLPGVDANGPAPDPTMAPVLLRFTANGSMLRCETPETGQSITFAVPTVTTGMVGLRSRRDAVNFEHVTVIQSP